ncbi:Sister chromatid cohesion protein [Plasmodiophora brassicae]
MSSDAALREVRAACRPGALSKATHRDLLNTLKTLAKALAIVQADDHPDMTVLARELASHAILSSSKFDIRMYAATCIVEMFRIGAPQSPWIGAQLQQVFRLLIGQLASIGESTSSSYLSRQFHILETLSLVRIPLVLLDPANVSSSDDDENEVVLVELFETCIKISARGLPQPFENCLRDMLCSVLEEADPVPRSLVVIVLRAILDSSSPRSADLAKRIVRECKPMIEGVLTDIIGAIAKDKTSESATDIGTRVQQLDLIYQLACLDCSILRGALPKLQDALESQDDTVRLEFVKLFGRVFSQEQGEMPSEFTLLLNAYLKRSTDINDGIREEFVGRAPDILCYVPEIRVHLTSLLVDRALDPNERVRCALVRSVCAVAATDPDVVESSLLKAIAARLMDKKPAVRRECITGLAVLFKMHCARHWCEARPVPSHLKKFSGIPQQLIGLFAKPLPDKGAFADERIDIDVIDRGLDPNARTALLLATFATCSETNRRAFIRHYFAEKAAVRACLTDVLSLRSRAAAGDADAIAQRDQRLATLSTLLPTQVDLKPVFEQKDGNVYKWLRACIDLRLGVEDVRTAMRNLHSALTGNKKVQHAADVTAAAAAMTTVGKDNVGPLVELARHHNAPKGNPRLAADAMALLSAFSEHAPAMMADVLDELASLIAFPATAITDSALRCVSRCCAAGVALERAPTEVLRSLCESGSVAQATSAAEILSSSREDDVLRDVVRLALNMDAPESAPVLSACAHIARNRMDLFQEADPDDRLVQRVQNEVFTSDGRHLGPAKAAGLRFVTNHLLGSGEDGDARPLLRLLMDIVRAKGQFPGCKVDDDLDVQLIAAIETLFVVISQPKYERLLTVDEFHALTRLVTDPASSVAVREAAVDSAWSQLLLLRIPFRYAIILVLAINDSDIEVSRKARKHVSVLVARLRQASAMLARRAQPGVRMVSLSYMPEYALVYLLHVLSADVDPGDSDALRRAARHIQAFMDCVLTAHHHNFAFMLALLTRLKSSVLAGGRDSRPLYALVEVSLQIVRHKYQGAEWSSLTEDSSSSPLSLPAQWFKTLEGPVQGSYLPQGFTIKAPAAPPTSAATHSAPSTPRPKRQKTTSPAPTPTASVGSRRSLPRRAKLFSHSSSLADASSSDSDTGDDDDTIANDEEVFAAQDDGEDDDDDDGPGAMRTSSSPVVRRGEGIATREVHHDEERDDFAAVDLDSSDGVVDETHRDSDLVDTFMADDNVGKATARGTTRPAAAPPSSTRTRDTFRLVRRSNRRQ